MAWASLFTNFVTFMVVLDPVGTAAVFAALTPALDPHHRRHIAERATLLAGAILLLFALFGAQLLAALGIGLPAFRVAGGLMLLLLAIDMVFARPSGLRSVSPLENSEAAQRHDLTVFPLAFPLIAGPGAMTTVVLLMGRADGDPGRIAGVLGVLLLALLVGLLMLYAAGRLQRLLGVTGSNVISRVLGIILAALAVQFIADGVISIVRV